MRDTTRRVRGFAFVTLKLLIDLLIFVCFSCCSCVWGVGWGCREKGKEGEKGWIEMGRKKGGMGRES